jgi:hypothetical protein
MAASEVEVEVVCEPSISAVSSELRTLKGFAMGCAGRGFKGEGQAGDFTCPVVLTLLIQLWDGW